MTGSSPRMRGTQVHTVKVPAEFRIIHAHAGNSGGLCTTLTSSTDHPRACGELGDFLCAVLTNDGSSPRMRGTLRFRNDCVCKHRIIPAHAGNSCQRCCSPCCQSDHPRACGELLDSETTASANAGSSPRMRGTHRHPSRIGDLHRIIPAHAGNSKRHPSPTT